MESAARQDNPAEHGYGQHRRDLLDGITALRTQLARCEEALRDMFALIDEGYLVRDTTHDAMPGWALRQLPYVHRLAAARRALAQESGE